VELIAATDRAAWRALRQELGWLAGLRVVIRVRRAQARREPFAELPEPATPAEVDCRRQAGDAVRLYRALVREGAEQALERTARVVHAAALVFLDHSIGSLGPSDLQPLSPQERQARVRERLQRFPNVQARLHQADPQVVAFTVTRCRLVELVTTVGHPELGPLFCAADATFFGTSRPGLSLSRPTTLATGGSGCAFEIRRTEGA